jgi:hypothetical protein
VLNLFYVGLALVSIAYWFENAGVGLIVIFIVLRTGFVTQLQTSEPRYVLVCFPGLLALGAQVWGGSAWRKLLVSSRPVQLGDGLGTEHRQGALSLTEVFVERLRPYRPSPWKIPGY